MQSDNDPRSDLGESRQPRDESVGSQQEDEGRVIRETVAHSHSDTGSGRLEVRCPNCHAPTDVAVDVSLTDLTCSGCGSRFSLIDDSDATRSASSLSTVGHFDLVERLGVGGYGTVWKARDTDLDRTVAVKIPRRGDMGAAEAEMFLREARAAAQLQHPNIVGVHEVGRDGDTFYIVSDLVRGVTLDDWLTGQQLTSREAAELCAKIASALHHAHEHGVIHRDLKPGNIMIDGDGEPHLMDFGLARREVGEVTMTTDGQILGTPAYMSPEQAGGEAHSADRRSDIYSLGVILFQLLTGELPFRGNSRMLMHQVLNDEPPSPRSLQANVSRDLETICLKCLEKAPVRRYQTAEEVASELERYFHGKSIRARPIGRFERGWRWCKRHPIEAGLAATLVVTLLAVTVAGWAMAAHQASLRWLANTAQREAEQEKVRADRHAKLLEGQLYTTQIAMAQNALRDGDLLRTRRMLDSCPEKLRHWEWDRLNWLSDRSTRTIHHGNKAVFSVAYSPDGAEIVSGCGDGSLRMWRVDTGRLRWVRTGIALNGEFEAAGVISVAYGPHSKRIATGDANGFVTIRDARTGKLLQRRRADKSEVWAVAFGPSGNRLVTGGREGVLGLWDVHSDKQIWSVEAHGIIWGATFSPDGDRVASASSDKMIKLWDAKTGELIRTLTGHTHEVGCVAFSPDGDRIYSTSDDWTIRIWDAATGRQLDKLEGHTDLVRWLAISPDGETLASVSRDGTLRLWDLAAGEIRDTWLAHRSYVRSVDFSPDASTIVTCSNDGLLKLWNPNARAVRALPSHQGYVNAVAVSHDGEWIASGDEAGHVKLWNASTGQLQKTLEDLSGAYVKSIAFTRDNEQIVAGNIGGRVCVWDVNTGRVLNSPDEPSSGKVAVAISPEGTRFAVGGNDNTVQICDLPTGQEIVRLTGHGNPILDVAFSHDGQRIVSSASGEMRGWEADTGRSVFSTQTEQNVYSPVFSPDAKWIVSAYGAGGEIMIWDAETGAALGKRKHRDSRVWSFAFSPDGRRFISSSADTFKVWNRDSAVELLTLDARYKPRPEYDSDVYCVAFSPDATRVVCGGTKGLLQIWQTSPSGKAPERPADLQPVDEAAAEHAAIADQYRRAQQQTNEGRAHLEAGRDEEAKSALRNAIDLYSVAIKLQQRVLDRHPDDPELENELATIHLFIGNLCGMTGQYEEALAENRKALEIRQDVVAEYPEDPVFRSNLAQSHNSLAWFLATCPNDELRSAETALASATRACELTEWKDGLYLDTLAAAHAEATDFVKAVHWQAMAIELTPTVFAEGMRTRLELYEAGKPYRDQPAK